MMNTEHEKNPAAVLLGRRGRGVPKRLSEEQREAAAQRMRAVRIEYAKRKKTIDTHLSHDAN